jgi:hypothetical protein
VRCEGCGKKAKGTDVEGVPLCEKCGYGGVISNLMDAVRDLRLLCGTSKTQSYRRAHANRIAAAVGCGASVVRRGEVK